MLSSGRRHGAWRVALTPLPIRAILRRSLSQRRQDIFGTGKGIAMAVAPIRRKSRRPGARRVSGAYFYAHDGNKNVSEVFYYALGNGIAAHYDYAPFGAVTRTAKATSVARDILSENPFRFSSEVHDNSLGLVYYNYRHYNPKDGRWLGRDRLEEVGQYLFLGNTAVSSVDLLGMLSINEKLYLTYMIGALRGPFGWVWNPELPNTDSEGYTLISDDEGEFRSYAKDIVDNFIEMIEQETDTGAPFGEWTRKEASGNTEFTISPPTPLHCSLGSSSRVHVSVTYERKIVKRRSS